MSLKQKILSLIAAGAMGITALGCPATTKSPDPRDYVGCSTDMDCKGDRVCYQGTCINPSSDEEGGHEKIDTDVRARAYNHDVAQDANSYNYQDVAYTPDGADPAFCSEFDDRFNEFCCQYFFPGCGDDFKGVHKGDGCGYWQQSYHLSDPFYLEGFLNCIIDTCLFCADRNCNDFRLNMEFACGEWVNRDPK